MTLLYRALAVFLVAVGFLAWALLIATPLYHDGSPEYPHWQILNYFMAAAVLIMLVKGFLMRRDRDAQEGGSSRDPIEHLRVGIAFYGSVVLAMLFYWEWFWTLNPESETGDAVTSHLVYFPIVDALFVVLCVLIGRRFWKEGNA